MRGEDDLLREAGQDRAVLGQEVQRVGIEHQRRRHPRYEVLDQAPRRGVASETGADHAGVGTRKAAQDAAERGVPHHARGDFGDGPDDDLGAFLGQDRIDRLRDHQPDDARARARGAHARQVGGAGKALRSRQYHHSAERPLVPIARARG